MLRLFFFRGFLVICLFIGLPVPDFDRGRISGISIAQADDGGGGDGGGGGGDGVKWGNERSRPLKLPDFRRIIPNFWSTPPPKRAKAPPPKARKPSPQRQPTGRAVAKIGDFEPREILSINATQAVLNQARSLGFTVGRTETLRQLDLRITRLRPPANQSPPQSLRRLQRRIPNGDFALNHIYRATADPCVENRCYGSSLINWDSASEHCGRGVKLGMVDTAVNSKTPALTGRQVTVQSFSDDGRASSPTHGTAVATLLVSSAASGFAGLLPRAELYAADTFMGTGVNLRTNALLLVRGLDWLLEQKVSVVNASLTGPANPLLHVAINRLAKKNVAVVAAAGNGGSSAPPAFPAAYPEAIAVTAVDQLLRPYRLANRGDYLTLAAPGVRIWTPNPGGGGQYRDGTSFAAPYVTAAAALVRTRQPSLSPAEVLAELRGSARDLGASGKDPVFGWGLVQSPGRCD